MTTSTHGGARRGNKATNKRQQQQKLQSGSRKRRSHYKLLTQKQQLGGVIERGGPNRKPIRRPAQPNSENPLEELRITNVEAPYGNWSNSPTANYPMVEYGQQHNASTARKSQMQPKKFTTQSTSSEAAQNGELRVESIFGELGVPPATPRHQMSPQPNASTARKSQMQPKKFTTQSTSSEAAQNGELIGEEPIFGKLGVPPATPRHKRSPQHVKRNSSPNSKVTPPRPTAPKPRMRPAAGEQPEYKSDNNWEVPDSLNKKYTEIPLDKDIKETQTTRVTINSVRKNLNRYPTQILPYVDNTLKVENVNYINASPITLKVDGEPQLSLSYIATQCPTTESFPDFWKMIFQYKVPVICMVTNLVEDGKTKCNKYYPTTKDTHGDITITLISEENISAAIIKRKFTIEKASQKHDVTHLHYTVWPDLDYPPIDADRAQLIRLSNEISKACNGGTAPPVIHCSAGVGRTGSIIAINYLMHIPKEIRDEGLKNENDPNMLLQIIKQLRQQRLWMVQQPTQFVGIIQTVLNTNGVDNQLWTCDIKSTKPT
jgi:protein tyrosine phosphatase